MCTLSTLPERKSSSAAAATDSASAHVDELRQIHVLEPHRNSPAAQQIAALASDESQGNAASLVLAQKRADGLDNVGVEAAAQTAIRRDHNHHRVAGGGTRATLEQRMRGRIHARRDAREHALRLNREGPRGNHFFLRATQLRRGDHLQRLRDLLRQLDGANAPAHVNQ